MSDDDSRHTESSQEEEEEEEEYEGEPPGQPQGRGSTFVNVKGTGPTTVGDSTHYHGNARIVNNFIVKGEEAALKILTWATQGLQLPNSANQQSIAYTNPGSSLNNTLQITQGSEPTVTEPEVTQPGEDRNVTRAESTVVITEQETTYSTKEQTTVNSLEQVNHSEPATTRKTVSSERTESIVVVTEQETTYSTKEESRVNSVEQAQPSVLPEPATSLEGQNIPSEQGFPEVATLPEVSVGKPPVDNRDGSREEASTSEGASGPAAEPENENRDVEVYSAPVAVRDQSGIAKPWWERVNFDPEEANYLLDGWLAQVKRKMAGRRGDWIGYQSEVFGAGAMNVLAKHNLKAGCYRYEGNGMNVWSPGDIYRSGDVRMTTYDEDGLSLVIPVTLSDVKFRIMVSLIVYSPEITISCKSCQCRISISGRPGSLKLNSFTIDSMTMLDLIPQGEFPLLDMMSGSALTLIYNLPDLKSELKDTIEEEMYYLFKKEVYRLNQFGSECVDIEVLD